MHFLHRVWAAVGLVIVALVLTPRPCAAVSGTMQIAWKGRPVEAKPQWPRGLVKRIAAVENGADCECADWIAAATVGGSCDRRTGRAVSVCIARHGSEDLQRRRDGSGDCPLAPFCGGRRL